MDFCFRCRASGFYESENLFNFTKLDLDSAYAVRFYHLSPDAEAVSVRVIATDTAGVQTFNDMASSLSFASATLVLRVF